MNGKPVRRKRRKVRKTWNRKAAALFIGVCVMFIINILLAGGKKEMELITPVGILVPEEKKAEEVYYPQELAELLERNPETRKFVEGYSDRSEITDKGLTQADLEEEFPHFLQWDKRWGYDLYGGDMIALSGCGPTCVATVAAAVTGDLKYNPLYVANYAESAGYIEGGGTSWLFMSEGVEEFGLSAEEVPLDYNAVVKHMNSNNPVIASVKPGDFTTEGHFIIIYGVSDNGRLKVKDPNSIIRSKKEWDWETIMPQIKNMWAYTKR